MPKKPRPPRPPKKVTEIPSKFIFLALLFVVLVFLLDTYFNYRARHKAELAPPPPASQPATTTDASSTHPETALPETVQNNLVYGGLPQSTSPDSAYQLLTNTGYVVGYSAAYKDPVWVAYRLFSLGHFDYFKRPERFEPDPRVPDPVTHDDYTHSGYDRGHMAPNFAIMKHYGQAAQLETFFTTNIVPQKHALNAGPWEALEKLESETYAQEFSEVWIIDGPLFHTPTPRLPTGPAIPDSTWKIIIRKTHNQPDTLSVIMPQTVTEHDNPATYLTPIAQIESATHLQFFPNLPQETRTHLESLHPTLWQ